MWRHPQRDFLTNCKGRIRLEPKAVDHSAIAVLGLAQVKAVAIIFAAPRLV